MNVAGTKTAQYLQERMSIYTAASLVGCDPEEFRRRIQSLVGVVDHEVEQYEDPDMQRDLSIRFHWGHNHEFGTFSMKGQMRNRHINIPAVFHDLGAFPLDLKGRRLLDIGAWTGGMGMLFSALGAEVVSLEEVKKYADTCRYLRDSFAIDNWQIHDASLFDLDTLGLDDSFDFVMYSGVLYHVTDMVLSLRHCFNALKDGGVVMVETQTIRSSEPVVRYEGARVVFSGDKETKTRTGWNWFVPSPSAVSHMMADVGFEDIKLNVSPDGGRCFATATRKQHRDMLRAGLARPRVR